MYDLVQKLTKIFEENLYLWKVGDKYVCPTESDMEKFLLKCAGSLKEPGDQIEVGRLIVTKHEVGYDVYVYMGEFV